MKTILSRLAMAFAVACTAVAFCGAVQAKDAARYETGPLLGISGGFFDSVQLEDPAVEGRLEYRQNNDWWFKPLAGVTANTEGGVFLHVGLYSEIFLTENLYVSPSFSPGVFLRGQSKNLGHPIEFRSQIEVGWRFGNGVRTSVSFNHISNAGSGRRNPGTESAVISLLIPFSVLF
ncbi:acyloxyacyl hydrolase [Minwuia sp.]|uniref:acyloxyacyl hydrolase n=1 Tax=Minwuia sp. TaxID=2493630 RepID=UPI003A8FCC27